MSKLPVILVVVEVTGGEVEVPGLEVQGLVEDLVVAMGLVTMVVAREEATRVEAKVLGRLLVMVLVQEVKVVVAMVLGQDKVEEDRAEVKVVDRDRGKVVDQVEVRQDGGHGFLR